MNFFTPFALLIIAVTALYAAILLGMSEVASSQGDFNRAQHLSNAALKWVWGVVWMILLLSITLIINRLG